MTRRSWDGKTPVLGIDIDGTLGQYHSHFLNFAAAWLGKDEEEYWPGPKSVRGQRNINGDLYPWGHHDYQGPEPMCEYMGISKRTYRMCKLAYRRGGAKRSMPVYPGAREMLVALRRRAWVVLCTTRPYLSMDAIEPDTVEFLRRNKLPYDALLMGEHKYRDLKKQYGDMVAAVVDDDPALLSQARGLSVPIPALFMLRSHNSYAWEGEPWWQGSCEGAQKALLEHLKDGSWVLGIQPKNGDYR